MILFSFIATKPPGSLQFDKTKHKEGIPLTPTGYTQPPTPDFPPPSPHTAILGIEERMAIIDVSFFFFSTTVFITPEHVEIFL